MIAYFILVHRYPQQFKRLFKAIYNENNFYLVHVDKRSDKNLLRVIELFLSKYQNTHLMKSQSVVWGGYSMVDVELNAMKLLLNLDKKWDTYINLSGQDFPLKPLREIESFLKKNIKSNFILYSDQKKTRPNTMNRINHYFEMTETGFTGRPHLREYMKDVTPFIGGQWKILTRHCCTFMTTSKKVAPFVHFYKNTLIADESFFQTVLMNAGYKGTLINDDMRAIIWIPDVSQHTNAKSFSDNETKALIEGGKIKLRPKTFTLADEKFLLNSPALFGRKFDESIDTKILSRIERLLCIRTPTLKADRLDQQVVFAV